MPRIVPGVLDSQTCAELIGRFASGGAVASGIEEVGSGDEAEIVRDEYKRRRDLVVEDAEGQQRLANALARKLFPAIAKDFGVRCTRFEGFKISEYPEGGFYRAHRDNVSESTAHRRVSVTLNLNDAVEGGALRCPDEGPEPWRAPAGGAICFRSDALHEVLPVTSGVRYVLITFCF
ncbi:MAG TPA: 2OG-Fe(II) oxygenase [bacterium]|nr:2OG-Fe(II) oxygenase [bacterium]